MRDRFRNGAIHLDAAGWTACGKPSRAAAVCTLIVRATIDPSTPGGPVRGVTP